MDSWANGAKGFEVKNIIDNNFATLDTRTIKIDNRISEIDNRISEIDKHMEKTDFFDKNFVVSDWVLNESLKLYVISIPYTDYNKTNPCVEVYIKDEDGYSLVYGGYKIVKDGLELQSDIAYDGKVVIR